MRNSTIKSVFFSVLLTLITWNTVAQEIQTENKSSTNTLEQITLIVKKSSFKNDTVFNKNKKYLRKAARLSQGDIDRFKSQIRKTVPSFEDINDTRWEKLYDASKLLTLIGKVEELPSVL